MMPADADDDALLPVGLEVALGWDENDVVRHVEQGTVDRAAKRAAVLRGGFGAPVWLHVRLPERDAHGRRTAHADWSPLAGPLHEADLLASPDIDQETRRQLHWLSTLGPDVRCGTVLSIHVIRRGHPQLGHLIGARLVRITTLTIGRAVVSARHRDGLITIRAPANGDRNVIRDVLVADTDPLSGPGLRARLLEALDDPPREAWELQTALHAAVTGRLRTFARQLDDLVVAGERDLAAAASRDERPGIASSDLLGLLQALGPLEREIQHAADHAPDPQALADYADMLEHLRRLRRDVRTTVDARTNVLIEQQLVLSRAEQARASQQQAVVDRRIEAENTLVRRLSIAASVIVVPTLVAAVWGANVPLPRPGSKWATWSMLALMAGLALLAVQYVLRLQPTDAPGPEETEATAQITNVKARKRSPRWWVGGVGLIFVGLGAAIAAGMIGDDPEKRGVSVAVIGTGPAVKAELQLQNLDCPCFIRVTALIAPQGRTIGSRRRLVTPTAGSQLVVRVPGGHRRERAPSVICARVSDSRANKFQRCVAVND